MKLDFKDYYNILGVSPQSDSKEIKKVYKNLAKKYHPDANPGNKEAEERFKEINEAYHAISDPAKRQKYDDLRTNYQQWQKHGGNNDSFDWSAWQGNPGSKSYSRTMSPEEFADLFGDRGYSTERNFGGFSDFFSSIFGMGQSSNAEPEEFYSEILRKPQVGRDIQGEITITLEEAYHGTKRLIEVGNRRIETVIPKGIQDNKKIRLSGQGEAGIKGGNRGDLLLTVRILPHQTIFRDGDDLNVIQRIDFYTAVLGGETRINTFNGEIILKIPPKTQSGKSFRLKGKGMPVINQPGKFGDFYVKISIVIPDDISKEEINKLQEMKMERLEAKEG